METLSDGSHTYNVRAFLDGEGYEIQCSSKDGAFELAFALDAATSIHKIDKPSA